MIRSRLRRNWLLLSKAFESVEVHVANFVKTHERITVGTKAGSTTQAHFFPYGLDATIKKLSNTVANLAAIHVVMHVFSWLNRHYVPCVSKVNQTSHTSTTECCCVSCHYNWRCKYTQAHRSRRCDICL